MLDERETIAAIASPLVPASRGLVRLSGSSAWDIALANFHPHNQPISLTALKPIRYQGCLKITGLSREVPAQICLWPPPRTYTGQPLAEIHTVGCISIIQQVLADCLLWGARLAEPGEFTLRAFLAGRLDLTQAEAVLAVIEANRPAQLQAALEQLAGGLSNPLRKLRGRLLDLVAHIEATLDFVEEPDVDALGRTALASELEHEAAWLAELSKRFRQRDLPERRPKVVLLGPANVGKSRLFNALTETGKALVANERGTTRDYLSAHCECGSLTVELVDTAGLEETFNEISLAAQQLRREQVEAADLVLLCRSPEQGLPDGLAPSLRVPTLQVWTQSDRAEPHQTGYFATSAATGAGVEGLKQAIADKVLETHPGRINVAGLTGARCLESLTEAKAALESASMGIELMMPEDLISLDLRVAIDALGAILGLEVSDEILDRIFSRFCIGK